MTPLKIHIVGTIQVGTYRSSKNYIESIKAVHIEHGFKWKQDLGLAYKRYKASTQRWMGPPRQSDPLKMHIVGTLLKVGTYRSSKHYIDSINTVHIEHGFKWKQDLGLAYKLYKASTQRGMGPPRQSDPLNLEAVLCLGLPISPIFKDGPISSKAVACLYSFFVLREVEGSLAKRSRVRVNGRRSKGSWILPV